MDLLKKAVSALEVDRATSYGVFTRIWSLFAGVVTILLIARMLSPQEQGFFYMFRSLLAMQIFFELGLTTVLSTFVSHEFITVQWGPGGVITGKDGRPERAFDLLKQSVQWFAIAAVIFCIALTIAGFVMVNHSGRSNVTFPWRAAWLLDVLAAGSFLSLTPFQAFIMGSGEVESINRIWLQGAIFGQVAAWVLFLAGHGLYAIAALNAGNTCAVVTYMVHHKPALLRQLSKHLAGRAPAPASFTPVSWWHEVWPMQWRIALSWASGYFIFQLFTPVLFYYHGAVIAGQMGMVMAVANSIFAVGMVWVNVKNPAMAMLVASRSWNALDHLLNRLLLRSTLVTMAGGAFVLSALIWLNRWHSPLATRCLPPWEVGVILMATVINVIVNCLAAYLRSHKEEPLLLVSTLNAVIQGGATWYFGMRYSSAGMSVGYFVVCIVYMLPAVVWVWRSYREKFHVAVPPTPACLALD